MISTIIMQSNFGIDSSLISDDMNCDYSDRSESDRETSGDDSSVDEDSEHLTKVSPELEDTFQSAQKSETEEDDENEEARFEKEIFSFR